MPGLERLKGQLTRINLQSRLVVQLIYLSYHQSLSRERKLQALPSLQLLFPKPRKIHPVKPSSTILVVDDEVANTTLLGEVLKKAGYGVNSANDGFKAIAA